MDFIEEILSRLGDGKTRFVFPSEVAAASALVAALEASGRRALPARRFVGWDAFKAELFAGDESRLPASKALRSLFARALLAENAESPFLSSVVPPSASAASLRFSRSVAAALPALDALPPGRDGYLGDWAEIRRRYEAFMDARGLYEAAWLGRAPAASPERWLLLYPDLTEDWDRYAEALAAMQGVELVLSDTLGTEPVPASRFGTVIEEVRAVLSDIRERAAAGADPASMMISVAAPDATLPVLEREARVAGIRLDVREGAPLADRTGGRLLSDILALAGDRMPFDALRRLLLDASRPWKEPEAARRLLGIVIARHVVARLPGGPDPWEAALAADDAARRLYRGLKTAARRVAAAPGFRSLRVAFDAFRRAFLDEERWSPRQDDELARCIAVLDELTEAAEAAGLPDDEAPGAAEAFRAMLEDTRYLAVADSGGVPVYRFPVAAGAMPAVHYAINLCQGAAEAAARPLSFLRPDERERLGAGDRDFSAGLVRLLARSGHKTNLSYSEDGPDGVRPPHPALRSEPGLAYDRASWPPSLEADGPPPGRVFPLQASSARAALATVFPQGSGDWSEGVPEAPARMGADAALAVRAFEYRDGRPSLTSTSMGEYSTCAFRRVYRRVLRLAPVESGLSFIDNLLLGGLYHEAFGRLLGPMARDGLCFVRPEAAGESARPSAEAAIAAMDATLGDLAAREGPVAAALVAAQGPALRRAFVRAATVLTEAADGSTPLFVDDWELKTLLADGSLELRGRPDLVCERVGEGGRRIVRIFDYKKRRVPSKASLSPLEDGSLEEPQIPVYAVLAEDAGLEPEAASYLSIEGETGKGASLRLVFGPDEAKPALSEDQRRLLRPTVEAAASATAELIEGGKVFIPATRDRERVCAECDLRPVCRARYTVR